MTTANNASLQALREAMSDPVTGALVKSWMQSTGLVNYDLQRPAKLLFPVITPLRNMIPRVAGKGGTSTHWKAITKINVNNVSAGVSEGKRGGIIATNVVDKVVLYKGIGLEDSVTFEADYASEGFQDVKALAVSNLLRSLMISEEKIILGGNSGVPLGITPTPVLTASASGGTLATSTLSVICVALTPAGLARAGTIGPIPGAITRTNADGTSDTYGGGSAQKSTNATVSVTGPNGSVGASVTPVNGAVGYGWFWGAAGSEVLGAITTINSVLITGAPTLAQVASTLAAADNSTDALVFDGLITQAADPALGGYFTQMPTGTPGIGSTLTSDGAAGIKEINAILAYMWDQYNLGPNIMLVNAQELSNITAKVIANGGAPIVRFNMDAKEMHTGIAAGQVVGSYLNKLTMNGGSLMEIRLHPNVPRGTIIFLTTEIPYPLSNVGNPIEIRTRRDYYQTEWPLRTRQYEYGVYADEVLVNYFAPAMAVLTNIANG